MIDDKCFTLEWIESYRHNPEYSNIQTAILEKMIHSLYLVDLLNRNGLDFVFKGGTSLILLMDEDNRFSIDVDIICTAERKELESVFENIVKESKFSAFKLDEKRSYKPGVPKVHYAFEYLSQINPKLKSDILLDVLREEILYPELKIYPVKAKWISGKENGFVKIPSIDSITGDKLTAFAPNTTGIPYFKGNVSFGMEICKQLFDIGRLFEHLSDIKIVSESFFSFAEREISYRKITNSSLELTPENVLKDILRTSLTIAKRNANKTEPEKTNFRLIQEGIKSFGSGYLMTGKFRLDEAITASAKVAYLASKILINDLRTVQIYNKQDMSALLIDHPDWNFLNKLKKLPDQSAFYYWYYTHLNIIKNNINLN